MGNGESQARCQQNFTVNDNLYRPQSRGGGALGMGKNQEIRSRIRSLKTKGFFAA
jgi:hypothetical protein